MTSTTAVSPVVPSEQFGDTSEFATQLDVAISSSSTTPVATNMRLVLHAYFWANDKMVSASEVQLSLSVEQLAHLHASIGIALDLHAEGHLDTLVSGLKVLEPKLDTETEDN